MHWGEFVREKRLSLGYGLRRFAELVGMLPSNYNHMEKGRMSPPQSKAKLDEIAEALGIQEGSDEYHRLMDLAVEGKDKLPADVASYAKEVELVPTLLRTLNNRKMSEAELVGLVRELNDDLSTPRRKAQADDDSGGS